MRTGTFEGAEGDRPSPRRDSHMNTPVHMKKRVTGIVLVSAMGVGAVSTLALTPALAATTATASNRLTEISNALKGLVSNGTITQAQADKVAATLDANLPKGGPGMHRGGPGGGRMLESAASVLGMTVEELKAALGTDKSLADVAAAKGISKATLISKLVAAAKTRLAADVKAGLITQAQANERAADLKARITEMVDRVGPPMHGERPGAPAPSSSGTANS